MISLQYQDAGADHAPEHRSPRRHRKCRGRNEFGPTRSTRALIVSEPRKPFLLRVPPDLLKELEKWAADDLRSVNAQMEFILRQAVAKRKGQAK
jgi:hypothetical protein